MVRVRQHRRRIEGGVTNVVEHERSTKDIGSIQIIGKRWFQRTNGNTYHSVVVYVNNQVVGREDFAYGYGEQYIQTAFEILQKAGYFKGKTYYDFLNYQRDNREKVLVSVADVERKKDM